MHSTKWNIWLRERYAEEDERFTLDSETRPPMPSNFGHGPGDYDEDIEISDLPELNQEGIN